MVFQTSKTMGIGLCTTTGMSTTSTPCTTGIDHRVKQLVRQTVWTMGISLGVTTV